MIAASIVVPAYNRADLIEHSLDALLAQTRPAAEIIVVDDGSTDATPAILERYAPRIRIIRIPNSGELVARNTGLHAAAARLVGFCDSDDIWEPHCLETLAAQWEMTPGLFACYSNFRTLRATSLSDDTKFDAAPAGFWENLEPVGHDAGIFRAPFTRNLLRFQPFFPSCLMVERDRFVAAGGWDEGVTGLIGCDLATTLRVADNPPVGVVRRPLVQIRKHAQNFSANTERMNLGDADVLAYVLRTRPALAPLAAEIEASMALRRGQAMESAFARQDFPEVRRIAGLLLTRSMNPKQRMKRAIASLPAPVARLFATTLSQA